MPIEHHEATIAVTSTGDASSRVSYGVEVRPDSMVEAMSSAYAGALRALKTRVETEGQH